MQRYMVMKKYVLETSPLGPSRKVKAAVRKAVKDINSPPGELLARLERLFLSKYGVSSECLLFANSLKELLFSICRGLRPKKVIIVGPALHLYQEAALASGAVLVSLCGDEGNFFLPDMQALVEKAEGCDLIFIANPNRISGMALSETVLKRLLSALALKDCITVIDESLMEFVEDDGIRRASNSRLAGAANNSRVIVLRTTACYFGLPGLELAWAIAGPRMIASLRPGICSEPSIPAVEAARTALKDASYRRAVEKFMKEEKALYRKAVYTISGMTMYDSDSNVFLLKAGDLAIEIARRSEWAGPAVELCSDIGDLSGRLLRISVMKHDHNIKFIKLLKRLSNEKAGKKITA